MLAKRERLGPRPVILSGLVLQMLGFFLIGPCPLLQDTEHLGMGQMVRATFIYIASRAVHRCCAYASHCASHATQRPARGHRVRMRSSPHAPPVTLLPSRSSTHPPPLSVLTTAPTAVPHCVSLLPQVTALVVFGVGESMSMTPVMDDMMRSCGEQADESVNALSSLMASAFSFGQMIGPLIGAALTSRVGFSYASMLMAVSLAAHLAVITFVDVTRPRPKLRNGGSYTELVEMKPVYEPESAAGD